MKVYSNDKVIKIGTYKRKRSFQQNKFWFYIIGMIVVMTAAIYIGDGIILQNVNN